MLKELTTSRPVLQEMFKVNPSNWNENTENSNTKAYESIKLIIKDKYIDRYRILSYCNYDAWITFNCGMEVKTQKYKNNYKIC